MIYVIANDRGQEIGYCTKLENAERYCCIRHRIDGDFYKVYRLEKNLDNEVDANIKIKFRHAVVFQYNKLKRHYEIQSSDNPYVKGYTCYFEDDIQGNSVKFLSYQGGIYPEILIFYVLTETVDRKYAEKIAYSYLNELLNDTNIDSVSVYDIDRLNSVLQGWSKYTKNMKRNEKARISRASKTKRKI